MPVYSFETYGELQPWINREFLQTNGTGAFVSTTLAGGNTRRYHGLLVGATLPPVGRIVALSHVNESLHRDGVGTVELGLNYFHDQMVPRGERYLRRFSHLVTTRWDYEAEGVRLSKDVLLCWGRNVVGIQYTIDPGAGGPVHFRLQPFAALRDFHALLKHDNNIEVRPGETGCLLKRWGHELHLRFDGVPFYEQADWWYNFAYPVETERGQDDTEDLFCPGNFSVVVDKPTTFVLWAGLEPVGEMNWETELARRELQTAVNAPTRAQERLRRAADDFLATRYSDDGEKSLTILAGFPWLSDWGRDVMIALPGLLLATERFREAGQVLCLFAKYVSQGMIPNLFDDYSHRPHYHTVDASLWFINACFEYRKQSRDGETFESILRPVCEQILLGYQHGTRFGIKMDEEDGLITQGDPGTQLTWMDTKNNGVVFTPRHGKAVEINALWYHALKLMEEDQLAAKCAEGFRKAFWINSHRGLADVVNETGRNDSCRPNQIFAVSLFHSPLSPEQQASVVDVVRRELLTPYGLRTLAVSDPKFMGKYTGSPFDRDRAYHNGTIWPWLIGPFLDAYLRVNNRSKTAIEQSRRWLTPLIDSLEDGCVGSVSEIYEATPPYRALGACAQAWSVSEVLRQAIALEM